MKPQKLDSAIHPRKRSYIHDDDNALHRTDSGGGSAPDEQPRTPLNNKFQENLRQSCRIYRHLDKIFNKLLDNQKAISKLQKTFANIFDNELEYVKNIIQRITDSNDPEHLREGTINNMFIFKENLKIFVGLMIENQYEEIASDIRTGRFIDINFHAQGDKLQSSLAIIRRKAMERIEEDEEEETYERSEKRSDKKPIAITFSSLYEKESGQDIQKPEVPIRRTIHVQQILLRDEKSRKSQGFNQNKSAVFTSNSKHLMASLAKPIPQSITQVNKKYDKIASKHSMKNLRDPT